MSLIRSARSSRRESQVSTVSSGNLSKSRSFLSNGDGSSSSGPVIEGNLQVLGGIDCGETVLSIQHSENGSSLLAGLVSGQIKVYNPVNGSIVTTLENEEILSNGKALSRLRCKPYTDFQPNTLVAATYVSGHLRLWNFATGQCAAQVRDDDKNAEYLSLSFNPFADVIAVGLSNGHIKLYDENTLQVVSLLHKSLSPFKNNGHTNRVLCIANHPTNPHEFVSSGWDNTLQFWDARCPNSIRSTFGAFVCGEGLVFDRKGRDLVVASWRGKQQLQLIDYTTGKLIEDIEPQLTNHYLTSAQYLNKDLLITCGTNLGIIKVVDLQKKATIASITELPGIYDIDMAKKAVTGHRFLITNNTSIVTIEYNK
eukprot:TCALIF_01263-PA protein Name:"Similar to HET-E1 Vegetative incompatibility protein HET-E-1 (Podospora anserina)" AED:0.22 eAED:0.22 QI:0/0.6/0.16/0.66/0.8/0.66/6/0/367